MGNIIRKEVHHDNIAATTISTYRGWQYFCKRSASLEERPFSPQNIGRLDISYKFSLISRLCSRNRLLNIEPRFNHNRSGVAAEANDRWFNRAVRTLIQFVWPLLLCTSLWRPTIRPIFLHLDSSHMELIPRRPCKI